MNLLHSCHACGLSTLSNLGRAGGLGAVWPQAQGSAEARLSPHEEARILEEASDEPSRRPFTGSAAGYKWKLSADSWKPAQESVQLSH